MRGIGYKLIALASGSCNCERYTHQSVYDRQKHKSSLFRVGGGISK